MATSGSVDFDLTRNEIIDDALIMCGVIEAGESPDAGDTAYAARQLNRMVKTWQADGVRIWTRREAFLFTGLSQGRYKLGPNSTDHAAELNDAIVSELATAAASGAATVEVDDATGMAAADKVGVVLDDGTIDWDTISSISTNTITLTGTLSGAAAVDNKVFTYTNALARPLKIIGAQRLSKDDVDTPIGVISHEEYQRIPNKTITGLTNEIYYHPEHPDGYIHLWPEPETAADRIRMTCLLPLEDFDATSDNPDFPQEWLDCLTWNLAKKLCPSYGVPIQKVAMIAAEADDLYDQMQAWDTEEASTFFTPDFERSG